MPRYAKRNTSNRKRRSTAKSTKQRKRTTKRGIRQHPGPKRSNPEHNPNLSRTMPVYIPKLRSSFYLTAESTGLQKRNFGIFKMTYGSKAKPQSLGTYMYTNQSQWVLQSAQGLQNVDYAETVCSRDFLMGNTTTDRFDRLKIADDPFQLNPWSQTPTNSVYTVTAAAGTSRNDMLYIKTVKLTFEILNMTLLPQTIQAYMCSPKYDTNVNPIDYWVGVMSAKNSGQTIATPAVDIADLTAGSGQASTTNPRTNPFVHAEFRKMWTSMCTAKLVLQAGEQINFTLTLDYHKVVSREVLNTARTSQFLKGLSVFPLFLTNSGLAAISSGPGVEASEVGYGEVKVGIISNQVYTFGALPISRKSFNRVNPDLVETCATNGSVLESTRVFGDDDTIKAANTRL